MKKLDSRATVMFNGDFFSIVTMSQGLFAFAEPSVEPWYLAADVRNEILGEKLRLALAASKRVGVEEFQKIIHSGVVQRLVEEREAWAITHYGYKSKRAMMRKMDCCWISIFDQKIEIKPTHHKSLDGYSGISEEGPEILRISVDSSDAALGDSVRVGFSRCTSAIR